MRISVASVVRTAARTAPVATLAAAMFAAAPAFAGPAIESHDAEVTIDAAAARISVRDRIVVRRDGGGKLRISLHAPFEDVADARLDGAVAVPERLVVWGPCAVYELAVPDGPGATAVLEIDVVAACPTNPDSATGSGASAVVTPLGAWVRSGYPWLPDDGGSPRVTLRANLPPGWSAAASGTRTAGAAGAPTTWTSRGPVASLVLAAGPWTPVARTSPARSGGTRETVVWAPAGGEGAARALLDSVERGTVRAETVLGPFPLPRLDVVPGGAESWTHLAGDVVAIGPGAWARVGPAEAPVVPEDVADVVLHAAAHAWFGPRPARMEDDLPREACVAFALDQLLAERRSAERVGAWRRDAALALSLDPDAASGPLRDAQRWWGSTVAHAETFLHSLRRDVGRAAFDAGFARTAAAFRGGASGWDVLAREIGAAARRDVAPQFAEGLGRTGLPVLEVAGVGVRSDGGRLSVSGTLRQRLAKDEPPRRLAVPVVVEHLEGREETILDLTSAETTFSFTVPSMPLRLLVDPGHDVLRRVPAAEIPACLAATLARGDVTAVAPDGAEDLLLPARAAFATLGSVPPGSLALVSASEGPREPVAGRSYVAVGDAASVPLLAWLRTRLPRHFPQDAESAVLATSPSPADPGRWITTLVGSPAALRASLAAASQRAFSTRVVFRGGAATDPPASPSPSSTCRLLLPDLRAAASPERVASALARFDSAAARARSPGDAEDAAVRRFAMDRLRAAGVEPDERPFTFVVRRTDATRPVLVRLGGDPVAGALPLTASPETPEGGVQVVGAVGDDDADLAGRALVVDVAAGAERPLDFVREAARLAAARGAAALFVRLPENAPPRLADLWATPETLHPSVVADLEAERAAGGGGDPVRAAAAIAARAGSDEQLPLPAVAVPHGFTTGRDVMLRLDVRFGRTEVRGANVVGRVKAGGGRRRPGTVVVAARLEGSAPASGAAAAIEAAEVLAAQPDLLGRDVTIVLVGAEGWGLRGSRAFVGALGDPPSDAGVVAMIGVADVGAAGDGTVVVGDARAHDRLARTVETALAQSSLDAVRERRYVFGPGADGAPAVFARRGIPAAGVWSATASAWADGPAPQAPGAGTEPANVARAARAVALSALAAAAGW